MTTGKYNFDRKWYEFDTFDVEIQSTLRIRRRKPSLWSTPTQEVVDWCIQHFGPNGSRWFWSEFVFNFRDQEDYTLFLLRWS